VFSLIATLIFLFVQMSWGIAFGHYAHYSTYMASRAYLSAGLTKGDQVDAATAVFQQALKVSGGKDLFTFLAPSRSGGDRDASGLEPVKGAMLGVHPEAIGKEHTRLYSWAEGAQYNFNLKVFLLPISAFVARDGQGQTIRPPGDAKPIAWKGVIPFTTDSFLGREPSVDECFRELTRLSTSTGINRGDNLDFIEDNGC
jgi:hypothetical protein